jgi:hypothetical protein
LVFGFLVDLINDLRIKIVVAVISSIPIEDVGLASFFSSADTVESDFDFTSASLVDPICINV